MESTTEIIEGAEILRLRGKLDSTCASEFDVALRELGKEDTVRCVVLEMSNVSTLTSAPLRNILTLSKRLKQIKLPLFLASPSDNCQEALHISGFTQLRLFEIKESVEAIMPLLPGLPLVPRPAAKPAAAPAAKPAAEVETATSFVPDGWRRTTCEARHRTSSHSGHRSDGSSDTGAGTRTCRSNTRCQSRDPACRTGISCRRGRRSRTTVCRAGSRSCFDTGASRKTLGRTECCACKESSAFRAHRRSKIHASRRDATRGCRTRFSARHREGDRTRRSPRRETCRRSRRRKSATSRASPCNDADAGARACTCSHATGRRARTRCRPPRGLR
jgi:anti-anti-sigma factor